MGNRKINYIIKKKNTKRLKLSFLKDKKIYCFFIMIIFLVSIVVPTKINAFTGEDKNELLYINLIKFTFPNIKVVSNKDNGNLLSAMFKSKKANKELLKNEVTYLKDSKEVSKQKNKLENEKDDLFTVEDKSISKFKDNIYDKETIINEDKDFKRSPFKNKERSKKPQVLIYHSHTHEGFLPGQKREENTNYNVVGVGETLKESLEKNFNINVIHDKTIHDAIYTKSYIKSGETMEKYLKGYGHFDLIIDLHRDSLDNKKPVVCKINGKNAARFMFVVSTANPRYPKQKKIINKMVNIANENYPGLIRGTAIYPYKTGTCYFNQHRSDNSILIEMGANCNHIDECKNTAKYMSRIIAEYLKTKNE